MATNEQSAAQVMTEMAEAERKRKEQEARAIMERE